MDNALVLTAPLPTLTFGARLTALASAAIEGVFSSAAEAERRRARLYFRVVLALATATSIAGNGAHAWVSETIDVPRQLAVAVAVAPPVILMLSIEGLAILVRNLRTFNFVAWVALTMTAVIAVGAFVLSFESLRDLAIRSGISIGLAFLWPAIVDVTIAQSTIALVVLTPRAKNAEPTTESEADEYTHDHDCDNCQPDADHAIRATKVLSARRRLRKSPDEVQRVLALADRGDDVATIATQTEMHPTTVRRILGADRGAVNQR
ncbi:Protein of uncharacterised function (DUF2637) [Mycobacteroides abscessus subsp. massiliense]|uniref:DUF2637 domain-containing protein n=1 Tax=Mycobacteroides abscessus TaxID=36809 RepID=UPI0009A6E4F0|nr:DUF2637 domain-containing protein [Mycobacteroides abscessus]SKK91669.1 Protein of uncharacterised function (DUF2637) [Mycobacteroides abscessus subsp. massiliense]